MCVFWFTKLILFSIIFLQIIQILLLELLKIVLYLITITNSLFLPPVHRGGVAQRSIFSREVTIMIFLIK